MSNIHLAIQDESKGPTDPNVGPNVESPGLIAGLVGWGRQSLVQGLVVRSGSTIACDCFFLIACDCFLSNRL